MRGIYGAAGLLHRLIGFSGLSFRERKVYAKGVSDKLIDALLQDDPSTLSELLEQVENKDISIGDTIKLLPQILRGHPSLYQVAAFLKAEECCVSILKNLNFKEDQRDDEERATAHFAAAGGSLTIFRDLQDQYKMCDDNGNTPAHYAAMFGNTDIIRYMLSRSADVSTFNVEGWKPIHCAAKNGHVATVEFLIQSGESPDCQTRTHGYTLMHLAAIGGHGNVAEFLIKHGAKKDIRNKKKKNAMVYACENGSLSVIKVLIDNGAEYKTGHRVFVPLIAAASWGHLDVVQYLVSIGTPLNIEDTLGNTPISGACEGGHAPVIKWLIAHGSPFSESVFFDKATNDNGLLEFYVKNIEKFGTWTRNLFFRKCAEFSRVDLIKEFVERNPSYRIDFYFCEDLIVKIGRSRVFNDDVKNIILYLVELGKTHDAEPNILMAVKEVKTPQFIKFVIDEKLLVLNKEMIENEKLLDFALNNPKLKLLPFLSPFGIKLPPNWLSTMTPVRPGISSEQFIDALKMKPEITDDMYPILSMVSRHVPSKVLIAMMDAGVNFSKMSELYIPNKNLIPALQQKGGCDFTDESIVIKAVKSGISPEVFHYLIHIYKGDLDLILRSCVFRGRTNASLAIECAQRVKNLNDFIRSSLVRGLENTDHITALCGAILPRLKKEDPSYKSVENGERLLDALLELDIDFDCIIDENDYEFDFFF